MAEKTHVASSSDDGAVERWLDSEDLEFCHGVNVVVSHEEMGLGWRK